MSSLHSPRYRRFLMRLREAREEAGLSQVEAARRLRWSQTMVSRSETGERRIDAVELVDLCKLYRMSPQRLLPEFPADR